MFFHFDQYMDYKFVFITENNRLQRCFILSGEYDEEFLETMELTGDISAKHMVTEKLDTEGDRLRQVRDIFVEGDSDPNVDDGMVEIPLLFAIVALKRIPAERRDYRVVDTSHLEALSLLEGIVRVYIPEQDQDNSGATTVSALVDHAYSTKRCAMPDSTISIVKRVCRHDDDSRSESSTTSTVLYAENINAGCGDTGAYYLGTENTVKHYPTQCLRHAMPRHLLNLPSVDRHEQTRWWVDNNMTTLYDASEKYAWSSKELYQLLSGSTCKRKRVVSTQESSTKTHNDAKPVHNRTAKRTAKRRRRR